MENVFSCTCSKCGRTLYEGEMLNIKGKYICENCANSYIFERREVPAPRRHRVPSSFFHFIFSMQPGAGHMYLGLMKKGLFQMCLFYLAIYMTTLTMPTFFGLAIPIIWMYSFFDSLSLKRRIVSGEIIQDDIGSETSFINRHKGLIAIAAIILLICAIAGGIFERQHRPRAIEHFENPVVIQEFDGRHSTQSIIYKYVDDKDLDDFIEPLLFIGLGGLIVYKVSKKRKSGSSVVPPKDSNM